MPGPRDCNSCSWIHGMMLGCRTDSASRQPSIHPGEGEKKEGLALQPESCQPGRKKNRGWVVLVVQRG